MSIGLQGDGAAQASKARANDEDVFWCRDLAHGYTAAAFKIDLVILLSVCNPPDFHRR